MEPKGKEKTRKANKELREGIDKEIGTRGLEEDFDAPRI